MRATLLPVWLSIALTATGCTTMQAQIQSSGTVTQADANFVTTATQLVMLDDQAGKLAATKAADPRVVDVSTQMSGLASSFAPELQADAKAQGLRPAPQATQEVAQEVAALRGLSGRAFDRQYLADELAAHQRAVTVFKAEDATTKDGALRTQVETALPAVQDYLAKLQAIANPAPSQG
jgi:putative membrane protein